MASRRSYELSSLALGAAGDKKPTDLGEAKELSSLAFMEEGIKNPTGSTTGEPADATKSFNRTEMTQAVVNIFSEKL
jgi:hypothetical protein